MPINKNRGFHLLIFLYPASWSLLLVSFGLHTAQISVLMVFYGLHLPLAFHFVCNPGGGGAGNKMEGKWKVSLCLVAPSRRRPRDAEQIVVFVAGPLSETIVLLVWTFL